MKARYATQGGGYCEWDEVAKVFRWVEIPKQFPEMKIGDPIPDEWGTTGPINGVGDDWERDYDDFVNDFFDDSESDFDNPPIFITESKRPYRPESDPFPTPQS